MRVLAGVVAALTLTSCGGGEKVGQSLLDFEEKDGGRVGAIDATTTTVAPVATTAAPARPAPTTVAPRAPATTAAPTTKPAPTAATTIRIVSEGQGFDPFSFRVRQGTRLRIVNTLSSAATFTSDRKGLFDSGPIAPGGAFEYTASTVGKHNFHDETRPFAVGQMEVVA